MILSYAFRKSACHISAIDRPTIHEAAVCFTPQLGISLLSSAKDIRFVTRHIKMADRPGWEFGICIVVFLKQLGGW